MIELNKIYNECCLETMSRMKDEFVDLIVTSPPYDNLRTYNEYKFDFKKIAKELYRITKNNGLLVWIVGDGHDKKGSETGTSFKQALYFKYLGFNIHDTMIYKKNSYPFPPVNRYYQQFEYMFVFSKGKPKTYNIQTQKTIWKKDTKEISTTRQKNGETKIMKYEKGKKERKMDNVWNINTGYMRSTKDKIAYKHPAIFPDELCKLHILSWSNENDIVYDPFSGSGTTVKNCLITKRNYIGSEISKEYCEIAENRIKKYTCQLTLF